MDHNLIASPVLPPAHEESPPDSALDPNTASASSDIPTAATYSANPMHGRHFPTGSIPEQRPACLNEVISSDLYGTEPMLPPDNLRLIPFLHTSLHGSLVKLHPF